MATAIVGVFFVSMSVLATGRPMVRAEPQADAGGASLAVEADGRLKTVPGTAGPAPAARATPAESPETDVQIPQDSYAGNSTDGPELGPKSSIEPEVLQQAEVPPLEAGSFVTVVTYNLQWHAQKNNPSLYGKVREVGQDADLIGFQECEDVDKVKSESGLGSFASWMGPGGRRRRGDGYNPAPIMWRNDAFDKLSGPEKKWVGTDRWGHRTMNWVRLRHKSSGKTIFFANTHGYWWPCNSQEGDLWVQGIKENKESSDVVIFVGDLNCMPHNSAFKKLKSFVSTGDVSSPNNNVIDHIMTLNAPVSGHTFSGPSDHLGVKGVVDLSGRVPNFGKCGENCNYESQDISCKDRVAWVAGTGKREEDAIAQINGECRNQCECTLNSYRGRSEEDSADPTPSPTPPTPSPSPGPTQQFETVKDCNVWRGTGAQADLGEELDLGAEACRQRCTDTQNCDCFVMQGAASCWLRSGCNPNGCSLDWSTGYTLYYIPKTP